MNIVIAQLNYTIGDFEGNFKKIQSAVETFKSQADLIVFSELCVSGYYPFDLLDRADFQAKQAQYIDKVQALTAERECAVLIGASVKNKGVGKALFNAALVIDKGEIIHVYHKHLLPVYNIYDEARHFERGQTSPVFEFRGKQYGVLICEDLWAEFQDYYHESPEKQFIGKNLEVIFVLNGSPSNIGKFTERTQMVSQLAIKVKVPVVYVNQVGGNDEIVYDGASFICDETGNIKHISASFEESVEVVDLSSLATLSTRQNPYQDDIYKMYFEQLKVGLRDYVQKCGFKGIVLGSSGGIDSALTLAVAKYALGAENVVGITMPSVYSSEGSVGDSVALCRNLAIKLFTRPIAEDYQLSCREFEKTFGEKPIQLTQENIQARIRGRIVMEYSNNYGVLAVSTGNKSEMSVGYATLYGDMNGALNILGDLYKEDVYALSRYINRTYGEIIPVAIIDKEPSAELSEDQKDSDSLPPYELLDPTLKLYLEGDMLSEDEIADLKEKASLLAESEVERVHRLVDRSEFKRKQASPIIRIQKRSFGMGRQVPVAQQF